MENLTPTASSTPTAPLKKLKPAKHRIVLGDGRELQYHVPRRSVEPLPLRSFFPEEFVTIEVEIGPGKGEFLARRAARYPERYFVGIDKRQDRFELTQKKLQRIQSEAGKNWSIVRDDARGLIEAGLPPIQVLHIYHPDPWPKKRHHKNRFFRSPDAKQWAEAIVQGGEFRFSTDHREYFEEMLDIVMSWGIFKTAMVYQKDFTMGAPQSHFEGIFLKKGEPVYKACFIR